MKVVVVGLGIQGRKRLAIAGADCIGCVDPVASGANWKDIREVPLASYDAALVCTPDDPKIDILKYLLTHQKHALVEKPLFSADSADLKRLEDLAQKNKVTAYTAYNHRFEPHFINLKNVISSGKLGKILLVRIFYGNGTARDVRNSSWRDAGQGVLPDIGSHLFDSLDFIFGPWVRTVPFKVLSANCLENKAYDHVLIGAQGRTVFELEATLCSWRNTFTADVIGDLGSAHIFCLCKWGPSTLTVRERVLPSGRPKEECETLEMADPTWKIEYEHFKDLCKQGGSNIGNDLWINDVLQRLSGKGI